MAGPRWGPAELARWRQAYRGLAGGGEGRHPSPEELASLVVGEATGEERERLADHVAACPGCAEDYRDLHALHQEVASRRRGGRLRRSTLAVAAVAAAALGSAVLWRAGAPPAGEPRGEVRRAAGEAVAPGAGETLSSAPAELRWPPQQGAAGYRVQLFDERGELLWEADAGLATALRLPPETRARLGSGSYYWTVDVAGPVARERLGPHWFRIGPLP